LNGFIALVPSRSFEFGETKQGTLGCPGFGLVLGSASGCFPALPYFRSSRLDFNKMKLVSHWNRDFSLDSFYIAGVDARSTRFREASLVRADGVVRSNHRLFGSWTNHPVRSN